MVVKQKEVTAVGRGWEGEGAPPPLPPSLHPPPPSPDPALSPPALEIRCRRGELHSEGSAGSSAPRGAPVQLPLSGGIGQAWLAHAVWGASVLTPTPSPDSAPEFQRQNLRSAAGRPSVGQWHSGSSQLRRDCPRPVQVREGREGEHGCLCLKTKRRQGLGQIHKDALLPRPTKEPEMSASLSVSLGARWAPDQGVGLVQPACPALATPHWPSTCISIWNCSTGMPEPAPGQR